MILDILPKIPKVLYKVESPISGEIKVVQKGPERRLLVNGVKQSVNPDAPNIEKRYWSRVVDFAYSHKWRRIETVLILGLGGGTVGHFLERKFPGVLIDGVEVDPLILEAGREYLGLDELESVNPFCADAFEVISSPTTFDLRFSQYDLVLVDTFLGGEFPRKFTETAFVNNLRELVSPLGIAIFNQTARSSSYIGLDDFRDRISSYFGGVRQEEVGAELGFSNFLISGCRV